jgi:DNA replication and repair protein RecF
VRLEWLAVETFRNLADARVELSPRTTVLLGDNGQGKTSLLEALGVLATTKSFRGARPGEMARHGSASFRVAARVTDDSGRSVELEVAFTDGKRATRVGRAEEDLADYISHLTVIPITQAQAGIVRGGPQDRRDFLDRGLLGLRPSYLRVLSRYRRALKQKAALLRAGALGRESELAAWNGRLAEDGAEITLQRRFLVASLTAILAEIGPGFIPEGEEIGLSVRDVLSEREDEPGDLPSREAVVLALLDSFEAARPREVAQARSVVGPHHDDLRITLGGRDVRRFASSGQQRNALLALKLAKVEAFRRGRHETPVLLVDDVDTEIDRRRLVRFLERVGGSAQALLTSSKRDLFRDRPSEALFLAVEGGRTSPC